MNRISGMALIVVRSLLAHEKKPAIGLSHKRRSADDADLNSRNLCDLRNLWINVFSPLGVHTGEMMRTQSRADSPRSFACRHFGLPFAEVVCEGDGLPFR